MCQLALDMFGQTLKQHNIVFSFRYENYARFFHKKCSECHAQPYLPVDKDLLIHGLAWPLLDEFSSKPSAKNFRTMCMRCAVMHEANIGFWIPTELASDHLAYFMYDGKTLNADRIAFRGHITSDMDQAMIQV